MRKSKPKVRTPAEVARDEASFGPVVQAWLNESTLCANLACSNQGEDGPGSLCAGCKVSPMGGQ